MEAGACPRPRGGRAASRDTAAVANKNLNLVDVYDIAADIGKVGYHTIDRRSKSSCQS